MVCFIYDTEPFFFFFLVNNYTSTASAFCVVLTWTQDCERDLSQLLLLMVFMLE